MSNAFFMRTWQTAIADLEDQLKLEGVIEDEDNVLSQRSVTISQAFQHFACLYVKYLDIYRKLEMSYDNTVQPQQRLHIKTVLELVIRRIIELRNEMVKWNPPNSFMKLTDEAGNDQFFPWEIVHFDDLLVDLKLSPEVLEIPVPKFIRDDAARLISERDDLVSAYMQVKHGVNEIHMVDQYEPMDEESDMTIDQAIIIIQRNERGRQACDAVRKLRRQPNGEDFAPLDVQADQYIGDSDETYEAASMIQRIVRGRKGRAESALERENELIFLGMIDKPDNIEILKNDLNISYVKRKIEQLESKEEYEKSLLELKQIVIDSEGDTYKDNLRLERTAWLSEQISQGKYPASMEEFYTYLEEKAEQKLDSTMNSTGKPGTANSSGKPGTADSKKNGTADSKKDAKSGKGKGGDDKKGKLDATMPTIDEDDGSKPKLYKKSELTDNMVKILGEFNDVWSDKINREEYKAESKYDEALAKGLIRPGAYEDLRKQVDDLLLMNLSKIQIQLESGKKGKKGKKKKKGKKAKKAKGKKKKPLPGEKISELKGMDTVEMLSRLIENKLVVKCRNRTVKSLVGEFNYLGSYYHDADRVETGTWEPEDPSFSQLRQMIVDYFILPNASREIREAIPPDELIKTIMLYGPSGTGKTLTAEIVANELGALLIHLNPEKLKGLYSGSKGATTLVHMVMTVACDPAMQPVVVYIDECEKFFTGGKKNKDKDGPSRFKKDFLTYKKQAMSPQQRCIIIGSTKYPENAEVKDLKSFFDKLMYMPYPHYPSRVSIWKHYIESQIRQGLFPDEVKALDINAPAMTSAQLGALELKKVKAIQNVAKDIDISSLAKVSEGYSAGAIAKAVKTVLTNRRVQILKTHSISCLDFIDSLALQEVTYQDDKLVFSKFTKTITGLDDRRKKIENKEKNATKAAQDKKGDPKKTKK